MIKIALKHWIYEVCIEQLFDGISRNFIIPKNMLRTFQIGEQYEIMKYSEKLIGDGEEIFWLYNIIVENQTINACGEREIYINYYFENNNERRGAWIKVDEIVEVW